MNEPTRTEIDWETLVYDADPQAANPMEPAYEFSIKTFKEDTDNSGVYADE